MIRGGFKDMEYLGNADLPLISSKLTAENKAAALSLVKALLCHLYH